MVVFVRGWGSTWQSTWHGSLHDLHVRPAPVAAPSDSPSLLSYKALLSATHHPPFSPRILLASSQHPTMPRNDKSSPASLSLPSPSQSPESSTQPLTPSASSSSAKSRPHPTSDGPPRKRSRTELTPDERKEARAHRNRIAAQNSRDRRKAQFVALEERIAQLEGENRTLRASMGLTALRDTEEQRAAAHARDRENQELKERIRTLESGWEAIVKVLQVHGLPAGIPGLPPAPTASVQEPITPRPEEPRSCSTSSSTSSSSSTTPPPTNNPTTFPVLVPPSPVFPLSPAQSHSSYSSSMFEEPESTRHLARVASIDEVSTTSSVPQQRVDSTPLNNMPRSKTFWTSARSANLTRLLRRPSMKPQWMIYSARFSHHPPRCPQQRFLLLRRRPLPPRRR